ncbi:MAG TPA: alpha-galactosidase, partial [Clostridiales bacterium]|nr:alpha-galactosidase [Clostridiales bacterium]
MKRTQFNISVSGDTFRIDTKNTSYMLGVRDGLFLGHFYYGPRIIEDDISYRSAFAPEGRISRTDREMVIFMDGFRFEYPGWGAGDSREGALKVQYEDGTTRVCPLFRGYEISSSKAPVPGLPSTCAAEGEVGTLRIDLADPDTDVEVSLFYSAFYEEDVIARRVEVRNGGAGKMVLQRVLSAAMDMPGRDMQGRPFELLTFHGTWAREFTRQIDPIPFGRIGVSSICGKTGNRAQSFLGIVSPGITQEEGEVYGLQFLYSGNFSSMVEKCPNEDIRVSVGIHPEEFSWVLMPGETFYA